MPGIEHPGSTGVIYCSDRAMSNGFNYHNSHEWANLGQGAPEVGPIPGAPPPEDCIPLPVDSLEYAPSTGLRGKIILACLLIDLSSLLSVARSSCGSLQSSVSSRKGEPLHVRKCLHSTWWSCRID